MTSWQRRHSMGQLVWWNVTGRWKNGTWREWGEWEWGYNFVYYHFYLELLFPYFRKLQLQLLCLEAASILLHMLMLPLLIYLLPFAFRLTRLFTPQERPLLGNILCLLGKICKTKRQTFNIIWIWMWIYLLFVSSQWIVTWNTRQSIRDKYVVMIGFSLENSRWADSNLTYRVR